MAISNNVIAIGLKLLNLTYTGACVKLRRSIDNATKDFYFNDEGEVDIISINTWGTTSILYVETLYDQSGQNNNFNQVIQARQPIFNIFKKCLEFRVANLNYMFANNSTDFQVQGGSFSITFKFNLLNYTNQGSDRNAILCRSTTTKNQRAYSFCIKNNNDFIYQPGKDQDIKYDYAAGGGDYNKILTMHGVHTEGLGASLYRETIFKVSGNKTNPENNDGTVFNIGYDSIVSGRYTNMDFYGLLMYKKALTQAEIEESDDLLNTNRVYLQSIRNNLKNLYNLYGVRQFARKIEVKRVNALGVYEAFWQDVETLSGLELLDNSNTSLGFSIANDDYNFGLIKVADCKLTLNSKYGEFDDENNNNSIFKDYIRHGSRIRIRDGYFDKKTNKNLYDVVFEGFIDETSDSTKVDENNILQYLQCKDTLTFLLKKHTLFDVVELNGTFLKDTLLSIINNTIFTNFFTVRPYNIIPGYNFTQVKTDKYAQQTQIFTFLEAVSVGHSYSYIKDGVFYYKNVKEGNSIDFTIEKDKIIKYADYDNGAKNTFERLYWEESNETYTAPTIKFNKSKTFNIVGIENAGDRQGVLNYIGSITRQQRQKFILTIPYYMSIFLLDKIKITNPSIVPKDAFIWDVSRWDEARWLSSIGASNVSSLKDWLVIDVKHSNYKTNLILQEIII